MGSLCSKRGTHSEDGTSVRPTPSAKPRLRAKGRGQTLGENGETNGERPDPRTAAALAAEERAKAVCSNSAYRLCEGRAK